VLLEVKMKMEAIPMFVIALLATSVTGIGIQALAIESPSLTAENLGVLDMDEGDLNDVDENYQMDMDDGDLDDIDDGAVDDIDDGAVDDIDDGAVDDIDDGAVDDIDDGAVDDIDEEPEVEENDSG
jgi:hypothetical protein